MSRKQNSFSTIMLIFNQNQSDQNFTVLFIQNNFNYSHFDHYKLQVEESMRTNG